ncbi:response regulator transcription factor [Paenibacillus hamazuiensis]|uniref:response regulator transcription factor n=1 Tax=Paenibacillus hamazuiensis TaxID=2936508 RepID=UPI00200F5426|nr:response regulator [Paenibacillus hamazuiensis]
MKVLIADDEDHVREGIELAVDWEKYGVTELLFAEEGQTAVELIRAHRPAVMFCDMSMPGTDGLALLRQVREEGFRTQIIVVSGYDDFIYTRASIKASAVDYILKPFKKLDLEQALEKAIGEWSKQESSQSLARENEHRLRQADSLLHEQKLAMYFKGEIAFHEGIRSLFFKVGLPEHGLRAALLLPGNRAELVERRFYGDAELFVFALSNIAHEMLKDSGAYYLCRLGDDQWLLVTAACDGAGHERSVEKVVRAWKMTLGLNTLTGICESAANADKLPASVAAARAALLRCELLPAAGVDKPVPELPSFAGQKLLLQKALENEDKTYAAEIVRSFAESLRRRGNLKLKELQACTIEANLLLHYEYRARGGGKEPSDMLIPLWISDLGEWERAVIGSWWALIEEGAPDGPGSQGIQAIRQYIHRNFHENISLSALSERFHFSPQYIARKFKEMYDTTVVTYLTDVRMDKAKSLLEHTELSVMQISGELGYADENYFSKVFKKQTGLSPLQYRKQSKHH